jgi:hypothetical protein
MIWGVGLGDNDGIPVPIVDNDIDNDIDIDIDNDNDIDNDIDSIVAT